MDFTYKEAKDLLECFGDDPDAEMSVFEIKEGEPSHSGPGLYAYHSEYLEEGVVLLGEGR